MLEFYGYFRSSGAYRVRIALNLKGVAHEFSPVHLLRDGGEQHAPAFRALNPQGFVPAIRDGDFTLNQSLAIVEWLDETFPEPPLLPDDKDERAKARAFAQMIACDIHPLQNLRVLQYLEREFGADQSVKEKWCRRWIGDGLQACEAVLRSGGNPKGRYCFGDAPGFADLCLTPQLFSARRFGVDLSVTPRLLEIEEACLAIQAFADAAPGKQPDAQ